MKLIQNILLFSTLKTVFNNKNILSCSERDSFLDCLLNKVGISFLTIFLMLRRSGFSFWTKITLCFYRGIDPSLSNNKKITPLMIASKYNRPHNIKVLMECKVAVHPNDDEDDGEEEEDDGEKGEEVLQQKVLIDEKDRSSLTALHYAAKRGNLASLLIIVKFH